MLKDFHAQLETASWNPDKKLRKLGTIDIDVVETTPVVFRGELYRFEWIRPQYRRDPTPDGYGRFVHAASGTPSKPMARGCRFPSAFEENGRLYVFGVDPEASNRLRMYWSDDMESWETRIILDEPEDWTLFNTSVCKNMEGDGYVMAIEVGSPQELVGAAFTIFFAVSTDLFHWEFLPTGDHVYSRERYTACPVIRQAGEYYYMIYLESAPHHRWLPYIVRTRDFRDFELGLINPVMMFDDADKAVQHPEAFTQEELDYIAGAVNTNDSDLDLCDYDGRCVVYYSWGNQLGQEFLAEAVYDGSMAEFLESHVA